MGAALRMIAILAQSQINPSARRGNPIPVIAGSRGLQSNLCHCGLDPQSSYKSTRGGMPIVSLTAGRSPQ